MNAKDSVPIEEPHKTGAPFQDMVRFWIPAHVVFASNPLRGLSPRTAFV